MSGNSTPNLKEKYIETESGKIFYYLDDDFPNKPTAVFLHGLSANHTTWLQVIKIIHKNRYT